MQSDGLKLQVVVVHKFGQKETHKHFDLYAEIVPSDSVVWL